MKFVKLCLRRAHDRKKSCFVHLPWYWLAWLGLVRLGSMCCTPHKNTLFCFMNLRRVFLPSCFRCLWRRWFVRSIFIFLYFFLGFLFRTCINIHTIIVERQQESVKTLNFFYFFLVLFANNGHRRGANDREIGVTWQQNSDVLITALLQLQLIVLQSTWKGTTTSSSISIRC